MGIIRRIFGIEERSEPLPTGADFMPRWWSFIGGASNDTGITVTPDMALSANAVWSAVSCISDAIAGLPLHVLDRSTGQRQSSHALYTLLHDTPNEYMTSPVFRTAIMVNLLLWGNAYAYIAKDEVGRPVSLYPLLSRDTRPVRKDGLLHFITRIGDKSFTLPQENILHVLGLTLDGINGLSPIERQRQTVGLSLALEKFAAAFFGRGANLGGVIETPPMPPEAQRDFLDKWRAAYTSPDNFFKIGMLPAGMKFHSTTATPEDAQAVQSRVHQIREVARIFRVPPHKLMDLERATFSNIEHQSIEFMQETVRPWAVRIEAEANRKLLLEVEKTRLEVRFNLDALLRADTKSRYEAHAVALNAGFATVNEVRALEGWAPVQGGNVLRVPLNMGPAAQSSTSRSLIESTARRFIVKEQRAFQRAAKKHQGKPDELRAWAESFYKDHAQLVTDALTPTLQAAGISQSPGEVAKRHCSTALQIITNAITNQITADDVVDALEDQAGNLAESILKGS